MSIASLLHLPLLIPFFVRNIWKIKNNSIVSCGLYAMRAIKSEPWHVAGPWCSTLYVTTSRQIPLFACTHINKKNRIFCCNNWSCSLTISSNFSTARNCRNASILNYFISHHWYKILIDYNNKKTPKPTILSSNLTHSVLTLCLHIRTHKTRSFLCTVLILNHWF